MEGEPNPDKKLLRAKRPDSLKTLSFILMFTSCFNAGVSQVFADDNSGENGNNTTIESGDFGSDDYRDMICSPKNFETSTKCLDFMVNNLDVEDLNDYFAVRFRYVMDEGSAESNEFPNALISRRDVWTGVEDFIKRLDADDKIIGDCEDIALFGKEFAELKGYKPFIIAVDGHVSVAWFDHANLYFMDTTSTGARDATYVKVSLESKTREKALAEKIESDPNAMNLAFLIGNRVYIFPSNFNLSERYSEIEKLLEENDFEALKNLFLEEIEADPKNLFLRLSYLNSLFLMDSEDLILNGAIEDILQILGSDKISISGMQALIKQIAVLNKFNRTSVALKLALGTLDVYEQGYNLLSLKDALSDIYLKTGEFEKLHTNDLELMDLYDKSNDDEYSDHENIRRFVGFRIMNSTDYALWITENAEDSRLYDLADDSLFFLTE